MLAAELLWEHGNAPSHSAFIVVFHEQAFLLAGRAGSLDALQPHH